jgi:ABC-2 type transport system ATP-binding protein
VQLRIDQLTKRYPNGVHALQGVSLTIPAGMFGLLGPNGAGKSTLMRTLATLQAPDSGSAVLEGLEGGTLDVLREKDRVRALLGYLPQEFGLYPKASAEELLDHLAVLKGIRDGAERRASVKALLQRTNLWDHRGKALGGFSGGMKRRFGIAQALLGNPRLLIVDEPTAGLDPEERVRFHNLLSEISENVIVILSTHIVEDVAELCPRMAILFRGRVLQEAEPGAAMRALRGRVFRRSVEKADVARFQAMHAVISTRLVAGRPVLHVLAEAPPGEGFEPIEPDLEDVYFTAIHRASRDEGAPKVA